MCSAIARPTSYSIKIDRLKDIDTVLCQCCMDKTLARCTAGCLPCCSVCTACTVLPITGMVSGMQSIGTAAFICIDQYFQTVPRQLCQCGMNYILAKASAGCSQPRRWPFGQHFVYCVSTGSRLCVDMENNTCQTTVRHGGLLVHAELGTSEDPTQRLVLAVFE